MLPRISIDQPFPVATRQKEECEIQVLTTKGELAILHSQIVSNLERAWEITGRSEDELTGVMVQISQVVAKQFKAGE